MPRPSPAVLLAILATACGQGGGGTSGPGGVPLDPNRPGDAVFTAALQHYDAANALTSASRAATDPAVAAAKAAEAVTEYRAAQVELRRLPVEFPQSIRLDNAAYLDGRCSYEVGTLAADPAASTTAFADARDRLDAAQAGFPASALRDSMAYFDGRARFQLAELARGATGASTAAVQALYDGAWNQFRRALDVSATGTWADNAAYYLGRTDFEFAYLAVNPLELDAVAPAAGTAGFAIAVARFDRAEAELAAVPASSTYLDNARYYLGKSHFEEPPDTTVATWRATRQAALDQAIAAFGAVLAVPGSFYRDAALFWRGRAHYSRSVYPLDPTLDLDLAADDLHAVLAGTSGWRDNALYHLAKVYVNWPPVIPPGLHCNLPRPGDATPASACAASTALSTLVASDPAFAASPYPAQTASYLAGASCSCP